jgi:HEAT repeat protein
MKSLTLIKSIIECVLLFCFGALSVIISTAQTFENLGELIQRGTIEQKRDALNQIRNLNTETAARLAIPALQDKEEIVRASAAKTVSILPKIEAESLLLPLLQDKSVFVRTETIFALGKIRSGSAISLLIQILQKDTIQDVKNAAIVALGEIGEVTAIETLNQILSRKTKGKKNFFRRAAARSIGQIAQNIQVQSNYVVTPEAFLPEKDKVFVNLKYQNLSKKFPAFDNSRQILMRVLQNPKETNDVKREAAFALGAISDQRASPILQANLNSTDYYLAEICKESLQKIASVQSTVSL